jgi:hypothetical protein
MSKKYLVLTRVDGRVRVLALTSNVRRRRQLEAQCQDLLAGMFAGHQVDGFFVQPWPETGLPPAGAGR